LTHKYRSGWSGLDAWGRAYPVKVLAGRVVEEGDDYESGGTRIFTVVARRNAPDLRRAIAQSFSRGSCHHEHDCCGCALYSATVLHRHGREYTVRLDVRFNY
jgi:hypothetical protein